MAAESDAPDYDKMVSVFHFTSKISSAKIRKYKIATERGMSDGSVLVQAPLPTPAPQVPPAGTLDGASASPEGESSTRSKRLKLTVREPSAATTPVTETPQESKPTPSPAPPRPRVPGVTCPPPYKASRMSGPLRIRYDENMVLEDESLRIHSDASDDTPSPPPPKPRKPAMSHINHAQHQQHPQHIMHHPVHQAYRGPYPPGPYGPGPMPQHYQHPPPYRHNPSAYPVHMPPPQHMQGQHPGPYQQPHPHHQGPPQPHPQLQRQHMPQSAPPPQQQMPAPPPPQPKIPPPQVVLVDFDEIGKRDGDSPTKVDLTVRERIDKLEVLSKALTNFGGVPAPAGAAGEAEKKADDGAVVDSLLNAFGGDFDSDDSSSGASSPASSVNSSNSRKRKRDELDLVLNPAISGISDDPLMYGIHFIQNALKSWALQRFQHYHTQRWQESNGQAYANGGNQGNKRGPGRPRKFDDGSPVHNVESTDQQSQQPQNQNVIHISATSCPEGMAVKAFQEVLDSDSLRVNALLPDKLSHALSTLYMQIDSLINQGGSSSNISGKKGAASDDGWKYMSYGAQIRAHASRVEQVRKMLEEEEEAYRKEMEGRTGMANPLQQGLPYPPPGHGSQPGTPGFPHHQMPPPPAHYPHPYPGPQYPHPPPSPHSQGPPQAPPGYMAIPTGQFPYPQHIHHQGPPPHPPPGAYQPQQVPSPGSNMRSGQNMRFSFPPPPAAGDHAVRAFGKEAFPEQDASKQLAIPRRGPMAPPMPKPDEGVVESIETPPVSGNGADVMAGGDVINQNQNAIKANGKKSAAAAAKPKATRKIAAPKKRKSTSTEKSASAEIEVAHTGATTTPAADVERVDDGEEVDVFGNMMRDLEERAMARKAAASAAAAPAESNEAMEVDVEVKKEGDAVGGFTAVNAVRG